MCSMFYVVLYYSFSSYLCEDESAGDGSQIQSTLLDLTGQRTVPQVFIYGKHIGGSDGLSLISVSSSISDD